MPGKPFLKSVALLVSGTTAAQLIPLLASPILLRLYSPHEFGLMALFMATVAIILPAVSGKFEIAMLLPEKERDVHQLFGISVQATSLVALVYVILLVVAADPIKAFLNAEELGAWIYLAPITLWCMGLLNVAAHYSNHRKQYRVIATSSVIQALGATTVNLALGYAGVGFQGLIIGNLAAVTVAACFQMIACRVPLKELELLRWAKEKRALAHQFRSYPTLNASSALLSGTTLKLPYFVLAIYFTDVIIGYYAVVYRLANIPITYIARAISQVYLKQVVDLVKEEKNIVPYVHRLGGILFGVLLVPAAILYFWAPEIFGFVLGAEWTESGRYARILLPALCMRFVATTVAVTIGGTNNNHYMAGWRITALIATLTVLLIFAPRQDIELFLTAFMINDFVLYALCYYLSVRAAKYPKKQAAAPTVENIDAS